MTIGKNSRKSSVRSSIRAPKFLDKASGFYGRLDEPENGGETEEVRGKDEEERWNGTVEGNREREVVSSSTPSVVLTSEAEEMEEVGVFDFNEGMMEDDGETLLQRKPNRRSSKWRRSSKRKQKGTKREEDAAQDEGPKLGTEGAVHTSILEDTRVMMEVEVEQMKKLEEEKGKEGSGTKPALVHFPIRDEADDQVLIRDKKRGREEEKEEEKKMRKVQEEEMKVMKRSTLKTYRKAFDRAFRRGWETFITNLYSVTLTPVTSSTPSSSSPASKTKYEQNSVLAEFQ
ncbi:uncharacterized protein LOC143016458 [Genypterus blacodes]|uniref:uncharacterized protein LOC143016458 n=1 Tax=Genypterus blacodes TaxID=154954 RepID=UPI003F7748CD